MAAAPPRLTMLTRAAHGAAEDYSAPERPYNTPSVGRRGQWRADAQFARVASSAACVRFSTCRRLMICLTCAFTVLSVVFKASPISLFDLPSEINARTSRCRRVSSGQWLGPRSAASDDTGSDKIKGTYVP